MSKSRRRQRRRDESEITPTEEVSENNGSDGSDPSDSSTKSPDKKGNLKEVFKKANELHGKIWYYLAWFLFIQIVAIGIAALGPLGKLAMLGIEVLLVGFLFYHATKPIIIGVIIAIAIALAGIDPNTLSDQRIKQLTGTAYRVLVNALAYAISLPTAFMIILDPGTGLGNAVALLFVGILLGIATAALENSDTWALRISQALLIGSVVKLALTLIPSEAGVVGDALAEYSTVISTVTSLAILVGWSTLTAGPRKILGGIGAIIAWPFLNPKRFFLGLVMLAVMLFIAYHVLKYFYPQAIVVVEGVRQENIREAEALAQKKGVDLSTTLLPSKGEPGVLVTGTIATQEKKTEIAPEQCEIMDQIIVQFDPSQGKETLATLQKGRYLIEASGWRTQNYYANSEVQRSDQLDPDGRRHNGKCWITGRDIHNGTPLSPFPEECYGAFVIHSGTETLLIGKRKEITLAKPTDIVGSANVFNHPLYLGGKGTWTVTLSKCR
jgi:hypothetical protein